MNRRWTKAQRRGWLREQTRQDTVLRALNARFPYKPKPLVSKLLHVSNDYFTAAAVFKRIEGIWTLAQCAPILHWMRKTPLDRIPLELLKRGCRWSWSDSLAMPEASPQWAGSAEQASGKGFTNTTHERLTDPTLAGGSGEGADTGNGSALTAVCVASSDAQLRGDQGAREARSLIASCSTDRRWPNGQS